MPGRHPVKHLYPQEIEVLRRIALSQSTKQIALELNIGVETAQRYRKEVARKLGLTRPAITNCNIAALTRYAIGQGLITVEPEWIKGPA